MKAYSKYKESGYGWIGDLPSHWRIGKLKHFSYINPTKNPDLISKDSDDLVTFLPMEKVNADGTYELSLKRPINELSSGFTYFELNDVIVAKITPCFENGKGALLSNLDGQIGFGSTEFHVLRALPEISQPKFLYYLTQSHLFKTTGEAFMYGAAGQKRVPTSHITDFPFSCPSLPEQQTIADFLDRKTTQIDTLIEKKQRQIDLLQEQRTALINHAVTKGLNPDVRMKDSGVEWLGEIPSGWEVKPLKHVAIVNREALTEQTSEDYEIQYIDISGVNYTGLIEQPETMKFSESPSRARRIVKKNDVIISTVRTYLKAVAYIESDDENIIVSTGFATLTALKDVSPKYLYQVVSSQRFVETVTANSVGVSYPAITSSDLSQIHIWLPPTMSEQTAIAEYIENQAARIDGLIKQVEKQIMLYQEYRTALISEAVTGKVDVR